MSKKRLFNCIVIGENNLALECSNLLISKGFNIEYIVSTFKPAQKWATERQIQLISSLNDFYKILQSIRPIDYLFSIVNGKILLPSLLQLPKYYSINYHDGLLPRYAGRHATSWAILNDEKIHGITWHVMDVEVDVGMILEQEVIEIDKIETTLSLNVKCYAAGMKSFARLLDKLANGIKSDSFFNQDLSTRTYFPLNKKPPGNGWINWNSSGEQIDRIYRALTFGAYVNRLGTPKIVINNVCYVIHQMKLLTTASLKHPGTLVPNALEYLQITTQTNDIVIDKISSLTGDSIPIKQIYGHAERNFDICLAPLDLCQYSALEKYSEQLYKYENFWVNELVNMNITSIPYYKFKVTSDKKQVTSADNTQKTVKSQSYCIFKTKLTKSFIKKLKNAFTDKYTIIDILITTWLVYLYRINNQTTVTVYHNYTKISRFIEHLTLFLSEYVPLTISFSPEMKVEDALNLVSNKIQLLKDNMTYLRDIYIRYPQLYSYSALPIILIAVVDDISNHAPLTNQSVFTLAITSDGTSIQLHGRKDILPLINKNDIKKIEFHLKLMLESIYENPEQLISRIPIVTPTDINTMLVDWNNTSSSFTNNKCIDYLFEEQAKKTPDNIAIIFEDQCLTYHDLNLRANELAHYLRLNKVGPEVIVGIFLERSAEFVICILAILKAGGAYLPLDSDFPKERLKLILEDAQPPLVISNSHLKDKINPFTGKIIELDTNWQSIVHNQLKEKITSVEDNFKKTRIQTNLAYVIYTSGSSGKPKGVMCEHKGLINRITWMQNEYKLTVLDRVLQKTPFSFDVSIWEIFWPLIVGASGIITKPGGHRDSFYLIDLINKYKITVLHFVPSMLYTILNTKYFSLCKTIKYVFCSGEALKNKVVRLFYKKMKCILHNLYGPTEASIDVTYWPCKNEKRISEIPIGRPIANTKIYILDPIKQPVPIGIVGEIYIGGVGLARGYLNSSSLTAEKFITNHLLNYIDRDTEENLRLYRSGDLGRFQSDGTIEFLGRIDNQVKLRGHRIELREIEIHLEEQSHFVQSAIVLLHEDKFNSKQLIAYIIKNEANKNTNKKIITQLKNNLMETMPEYMVPPTYIFMDAYPLTLNGKLDIKAFPSPKNFKHNLKKNNIKSENTISGKLKLLWNNLLGVANIKPNDNFFYLGGDSLLATQLISFLKFQMKLNISLVDLFNNPTFQMFANLLEKKTSDEVLINNISVAPKSNNYPLSFCQQRLWILDQIVKHKEAYNIPLAIKLKGSIDCEALETAFTLVLKRQDILSSNILNIKGTPVQVNNNKDNFYLEKIPVQDQDNFTINSLLVDSASETFNLKTDRLIKAKIFILSQNISILLIVMHHIICDESSLHILLKELSTFYNSIKDKKTPSLPMLPIQYHDFSVWQDMQYKNHQFQQQFEFWQENLKHISEKDPLPIDNPRPEFMSQKGKTLSIELTEEISNSIQNLSNKYNVTTFMCLLSALKLLIFQYSGQRDIIIGTPINERKYFEIENLIGSFVNTVALRTKIDLSESFVQLLNQVKEVVLAAYSNSDIPYHKLIDRLKLKRHANKMPLYQIMMASQTEEFALNIPGIEQELLPCFTDTSKLDLTFYIQSNRSKGLLVNIEYATELFNEKTIVNMLSDFQNLLTDLITNPILPLSRSIRKCKAHKVSQLEVN